MRKQIPIPFSLALLAALLGIAMPAGAGEYFVGPHGRPDAEGAREDPWDIYSALSGFKEVVARDNTIIQGSLGFDNCGAVEEENNTILRENPGEPKTVLLPNQYDENRAYLAIYNFAAANAVEVNVAGFMASGEAYRLMNPEDLFGEPLAEGVCDGGTISAPMLDAGGEPMPFAALVLLKAVE